MSFWVKAVEFLKCAVPKLKALFGSGAKAETRTREDLTKREMFRQMVLDNKEATKYLVARVEHLEQVLTDERDECRRGTEKLERENAALCERCEKLEKLVAELQSQINPPGHPLL